MWAIKFLIGIFSFYVLLVLLLYFRQNTLVYYPPKLDTVNTGSLHDYKSQIVQTEDGLSLSGYLSFPKKGKPIILMFHGNASHPAWEAAKFSHLLDQGYGIFLAEYRGYGGNSGIPAEEGLYKDADAYVSWLRQNIDFNNNPLIIYGASLGSGVAVDLASRNPDIAALIVEVGFNRLSDVGTFHYPYIPFAQYLMNNKYDNAQKIKSVHAPVLIMLAGDDKLVPIKFGKALYDAANSPKSIHVFDGAAHTNIYDFGAADIMGKFLKDAGL